MQSTGIHWRSVIRSSLARGCSRFPGIRRGERLTHLKITGGVLKTKALLTNLRTGAKKTEDTWEEKINQIRPVQQ